MFKGISKTVWVLSIISLCTDAASEMLYPVMPVYLKSIGFSIVFIGLLEGIAEAVAGLSKGYFGKLSDVSGKRLPFVQLGYTLSALSKPMLAFFINPIWVFFSRTTDRLGKGIRTGARDALLSDESTSKTKGKIFGFHRSMDTLGAVIGPAIALIYLYFNPSQYKNLFLLAFIPGLLAILSTLFLKQKDNPAPKEKQKVYFFSFLNYWKQSDSRYRKLLIGLLAFALFNSSDVFLLLKVKEAGINDTYVIGIYIFYNLIYSLSAFPMGILADKLGMKKIFITGLVIFSIVYAGIGITTELWWFVILFLLYGIYAAATEGIAKAWISNIADKKDTATAIGTYTGFQSICSLFASSFTGLIWYQWGSTPAFIVTAVVTLLVIVYFLLSE
jgi:MFS family permease